MLSIIGFQLTFSRRLSSGVQEVLGCPGQSNSHFFCSEVILDFPTNFRFVSQKVRTTILVNYQKLKIIPKNFSNFLVI